MQLEHPSVRRPEHVPLKPRNLRFKVPRDIPRYWFDGDPFVTSFMSSLSLTFPRGERSFIESVKAVREHVKCAATRADLTDFMAQEALHSREHDDFNDVLAGQGYPVAALQQRFDAEMDRRKAAESDKWALAITAALEHLTALFGHMLLSDKALRERIHPDVRVV